MEVAVAALVALAAAAIVAWHAGRHREADRRDVGEVHAALARMDALVRDLERDRQAMFGELAAQLRVAGQQTGALADTTARLREVLVGTKSRGQWGERMAEDVLRTAGLVEHVNYRKQAATGDGGVPDFTFLLPGGQVCHMDVKFPLNNYLRAVEATDQVERQRSLKLFRHDVRERVAELSQRHYEAGDASLAVVLLFIPTEHMYGAIFELDPELLDGALARKVVLCSPCTLFWHRPPTTGTAPRL